ncbi:MAG: cytochrome c oxidase assembly protein [Trueperaceae bacterium]
MRSDRHCPPRLINFPRDDRDLLSLDGTLEPHAPMILPWVIDPVLIGTLLTLGVAYGLLAGPLRSRLEGSVPATRMQITLFTSGLLVAFLTEASPLHELSERYLFSAHMVQHLLLSYVVAPLLIAGTPGWMVRPLAKNRIVGPVFLALTRPLIAFIVFSLAFTLWHLPMVYEAALISPFVHHLQHVIFLALAVLIWWPVMSPLPEIPRSGYGVQVFYLAALPLGQFFVAAILTFAPESFYPTYQAASRILPMSAAADQQLGGVIMKIASFIAFGIPLVVAFLRWFGGDRSSPATRPSAH